MVWVSKHGRTRQDFLKADGGELNAKMGISYCSTENTYALGAGRGGYHAPGREDICPSDMARGVSNGRSEILTHFGAYDTAFFGLIYY